MLKYWKKQPLISFYLMNHYVIKEYTEINWLCKHRRKLRSSQAYILTNSCAELRKTVFLVSIVKTCSFAVKMGSFRRAIIFHKFVFCSYFFGISVRKLACFNKPIYFEQAWGLQYYLKMRLWHRFFPVNFAKFLRTFFSVL